MRRLAPDDQGEPTQLGVAEPSQQHTRHSRRGARAKRVHSATSTGSGVIQPGIWRSRITAFVARHELAWDLSMAGLALLYLALGFLEDHRVPGENPATLASIELVITGLFLGEFVIRIYAAESRWAYLKRHWIDLLALVPSIRALRFLRLGRAVYIFESARVLRLGALVRLLTQLDRARKEMSWIAQRNGVHYFFVVAVGLTFLGGLVLWDLESGSNPAFRNLGDALWWAFATMTTVGYGNGPVTVPGRLVAGLLMVVGIGCFGVLTATVSAYFSGRIAEPEVSSAHLKTLLEDIQNRLDRLEQHAVAQRHALHSEVDVRRALNAPAGDAADTDA